MKTNKENDYLKELFRQLPEGDSLPVDFRERMMQQVMLEAQRVKRRNRHLSWLALIGASLTLLALGIVAIVYLEVPRVSFTFSLEALRATPFYFYIAFLSFLLLVGDYYFRKRYREKHKKE